MGSTCCQGRTSKIPSSVSQASVSANSGVKVLKRKRKFSIRRESFRARTGTESDPKIKVSGRRDSLLLTSFSNVFQKLSKAAQERQSLETVHEEGNRTVRYLRSESERLDLHTTNVASLSTNQQLQVKRMMVDDVEQPLSLFGIVYSRKDGEETKCLAILSNIRVYFAEGTKLETAKERIEIIDIAVVCLQAKAATCVLYICSPEESFLVVTSAQLWDFLKAVQFLCYQIHQSFIPVVVFSSYDKMLSYTEALNLSDINSLHTIEVLKTQELIMTTGVDLEESKILIQPCTKDQVNYLFLLTTRKIYILTKEFRPMEMMKLEEIKKVESISDSVVISGEDKKMELSMQDCVSAIESARRSV